MAPMDISTMVNSSQHFPYVIVLASISRLTDVGITVRWKHDLTTWLMAVSAIIAFIVAGVNLSCVRTSVHAELVRKGGLPST